MIRIFDVITVKFNRDGERDEDLSLVALHGGAL